MRRLLYVPIRIRHRCTHIRRKRMHMQLRTEGLLEAELNPTNTYFIVYEEDRRVPKFLKPRYMLIRFLGRQDLLSSVFFSLFFFWVVYV